MIFFNVMHAFASKFDYLSYLYACWNTKCQSIMINVLNTDFYTQHSFDGSNIYVNQQIVIGSFELGMLFDIYIIQHAVAEKPCSGPDTRRNIYASVVYSYCFTSIGFFKC